MEISHKKPPEDGCFFYADECVLREPLLRIYQIDILPRGLHLPPKDDKLILTILFTVRKGSYRERIIFWGILRWSN